jgi:hypothetical protein
MLRPEIELIYFSCDLCLNVPNSKYRTVAEAVVKANERIWAGHFDFISGDNRIVFSFTIPFIYSFSGDESAVESAMNIVKGECDRFYYYFFMTIKNGKLPEELLQALFMESVGEA